MHRRWLAGAAFALVLLLIVVGLLTPSGGGRRTRPTFGISVNRVFNDRRYTPAQVDELVGAVRAHGLRLARSDAFWGFVEPTPPVDGRHTYDWRTPDAIVAALAAHGVRWLPILDYSAPWASSVKGSDHAPPRSIPDFVAYATAFARRYGRHGTVGRRLNQSVTTYEIWNEPSNAEFWRPAPDPARYADLYLAAAAAIHKVDPQAVVLIGGLTPGTSFLQAMYAARPALRGSVDAVGIHPYASRPAGVLSEVGAVRAALDALGEHEVPLWITEVGWTTNPPTADRYAPDPVRAKWLAQVTATLRAAGRACGIAAVIPYTWVTPQRNVADREDWYGIYDPSGHDTTTSLAYDRAAHGGGPPPGPDPCPGH